MKITAFNGSPRAEQSTTNIIVQKFLEGAKLAGAEVDNVFLINKNINHCTGCFSCWFKTPGQCVFNDDMKELLEKYMSSDIICFATPVYSWNMTAALKNFVDRLIPLRHPVTTKNDGHYDMELRVKFPEAIVISNCGFPGVKNFETIKEVFKSCNPALEIYRNCGTLLRTRDPEIKTVVDEYLEYVKKAGFELVTSNQVSDNTKCKLQMEISSPEEYVKMMNI
ncbi:flavodoxin family protein [Propionispora hippei]|uniref:NADPH-dependent FMN reductase n=1 Tax=Propionispora hippei DSM 15287 TaxID=1123003 RepID=A0A1M6MTF8_9FIRM|nr:flavodoxin family protein [Propionispora hippei]SHJ86696.1 NADPH-dependent FMN reductase [Propionispora hippei DSM 15287]